MDHQSNKDLVKNIVDEILSLYNRFGHEEYGEKVTMLMHMMQSALWAESQNASNEMVVAAFLHDIGHFFENEEKMGEYGKLAHDDIARKYLKEKGFPDKMGQLVASHVAAKRYLTAKEPSYYNELSEASKETLKFQGGPMNPEEVLEFESDPSYKQYIEIRRWDDLGKDSDMKVLPEDLDRMKARISDYLFQSFNQN